MTERLGVKPMRKVGSKEPWSRRRLQGQINKQRKDLSQLEQIRKEECNRRRIKPRLETKCKITRKCVVVVMEELKHRPIIFLPSIWKLLTGIIS